MLENRKSEHIRINLEEDVTSSNLTTGLENYRFEHNALPNVSLAEIDLQTKFLGKRLSLPLLISSMTGGTSEAQRINLHLAEAAQETGIALGLGSLRAALAFPHLQETFQIRHIAPDILLLANLGAAQLNTGLGPVDCQRAVDMVGANGLILHLNPLQEALQADGDTNWAGLLGKIENVCRCLSVPVIVKEVGWGISVSTAIQLTRAGVSAIDVAGAGGTSWSQVEMHRAPTERLRRLASEFIDWGIPTAESLVGIRQALPHVPLIASGGLRSGMDLAKVVALGASLGGIAGPFLAAANDSTSAVVDLVAGIGDLTKTIMFTVGAHKISALQECRLVKLPM